MQKVTAASCSHAIKLRSSNPNVSYNSGCPVNQTEQVSHSHREQARKAKHGFAIASFTFAQLKRQFRDTMMPLTGTYHSQKQKDSVLEQDLAPSLNVCPVARWRTSTMKSLRQLLKKLLF